MFHVVEQFLRFAAGCVWWYRETGLQSWNCGSLEKARWGVAPRRSRERCGAARWLASFLDTPPSIAQSRDLADFGRMVVLCFWVLFDFTRTAHADRNAHVEKNRTIHAIIFGCCLEGVPLF